MPARLVEVVAKCLRPRGMPKLRHRLALDLTDALARELERTADLVEGARLTVVEPVSHAHDSGLARLERAEHGLELAPHQAGLDGRLGCRSAVVGDEVAERRIVVGTDCLVEADEVTREVDQLADPLLGDVQLVGKLAVARFAAELLIELAADALQLVHLLYQVHGQPDRARLVGHRAADRLADPPGGVCRELEALGVVELLDSTDQAEVALLDQVEEWHA